MSTEPAPEPLTDALAVDLGQTHDHEIGLHDRFEFVFRAQAEALIARGWTLATPSSVTPDLRDALIADLERAASGGVERVEVHPRLLRRAADAIAGRFASVTPSEPTPAEPLCTCGAPRSHGSHRTDHTFRASVTPSEPTLDAAPELRAALERHVEPHKCPREGPWSACDFNRFGRGR